MTKDIKDSQLCKSAKLCRNRWDLKLSMSLSLCRIKNLRVKLALMKFLPSFPCKPNCEDLNQLYKLYIRLLLAQKTTAKLACANYANPAFTPVIGGTIIVMNRPTLLMLWFLCWAEWLVKQKDLLWLIITHCSG